MSYFSVIRGLFNGNPKEITANASGSLQTIYEYPITYGYQTSTALSGSEVYQSGWIDISNYQQLQTTIFADSNGTMKFEFASGSSEGAIIRTLNIPYSSSQGFQLLSAPCFTEWARYTYTNGLTPQTKFVYETKLLQNALSPQLLPINGNLSSTMISTVNRSISVGENPAGTFVNTKTDGFVFQTTDILTSGSSYTSSLFNTDGFTQIETTIYSDVPGTLVGRWYSDAAGTDLIRTFTRPYSTADTGSNVYFSSPIFGPYLKYTYTNGSTSQGEFYFSLTSRTKPLSGQIVGLNDFIPTNVVANLGRNVLVGQDNAGNFRNTGVDSQGRIKINIDEPLTAFGELSVAAPTPEVQVDFVYGGNNQLITSSVAINGQVTYSDGLVNVTTSGSVGSSAIAYTTKFTKYRPGQGAEGRFTALFTTGSSGVNQYAGLSTPSLSTMIAFGYSGSSFGIWHKSSGSFSNFISQSSWNEDKMDGSRSLINPSGQLLDPTKGNVYQIKYQYLGFGSIYCYIEDSSTGTFEPVHKIEYANANTVTSFRNPSFSLLWAAENVSGTGLATVKGASGATFVEGHLVTLGPKNSVDNNKSLSANTSTVILSLKNASSYNGLTNRAVTRIKAISLASDMGNTNAGIQVLQVWKQTTLNASSFIAINGTTVNNGDTITNGNSTVSYDTVGASITTSSLSYNVFNMSVARNANMTQDVSEFGLNIYPGETMTFLTKTIGGGTQQSSVSVNWTEDI